MAKTKKVEYKKVIIFGFVISLIMGFIGTLTYLTCTDEFGCLIFMLIPLFPGILINAKGFTIIFVSLIFWFLVGALIGFLVYRLKKAK